MGDLRKRLVELAASVVRGNYDPTEPPPGRWSRVQKWRDHDAAVDRLKRLGLAIKDIADGEAKATTDALRSIAAIIGCPANADPLTDLDGLVSMVRVVTADRDALMAETDARIADAVAAERHAAGAWIRSRPDARPIWAQCIEHGDHIEQDESITAEPAPPLPSLRLTLAANRMLLEKVEVLTAERDRRLDPVKHAREVQTAYAVAAYTMFMASGLPDDRAMSGAYQLWRSSKTRATLLARVGADVLAEVER